MSNRKSSNSIQSYYKMKEKRIKITFLQTLQAFQEDMPTEQIKLDPTISKQAKRHFKMIKDIKE